MSKMTACGRKDESTLYSVALCCVWLDQFQRPLDEWREQTRVPAAAAAVRVDNSLIWHGVSKADGTVLPSSLFPIYSITKTLTAVCLLRLDQSGVLSVDDPIARWLPDLALPESVTLARLANHTAGIPDYGPLPEYHEAVRVTPSTPWTDEKFLAATLGNGLLFEPGNGWSYSNIGYMFLRRAIEKATGGSLRRAIAEQVVKPLGLMNTFIAETIADWPAGVHLSTYHPDWCAPGVAVSTVDEVTVFFDALFSGRLLDKGRMDQMVHLVRVPGSHPPAVEPSYGMGIMADPGDPLGPSYGHGGDGPGYSLFATILPHSPKGRLSVAVFCDAGGADAGQGVHVLCRAAVESSV